MTNTLNKLINLDITITECWVDCIATSLMEFKSNGFTQDFINIGKCLNRATLYFAYKANPDIIIAAIQANGNVSTNFYILHGILYNEQEAFMSQLNNYIIVCSRRIYFAATTLYVAARTKKDYSLRDTGGVESASSLDHQLLLAISTLSKEYLDDSDSIERYIAILNDNDGTDSKLLQFHNCMTKSYDNSVLKLITAAHNHPVLWIRLMPVLLDELKNSIPSSPNEKKLIICKLQTEINKNSLLWITIILCLNILPPFIIQDETGIFRDLLGIKLLINFLSTNVDTINNSSHGYTVLELFQNSLSTKKVENLSMLQQYLFT